MEQTNYQELDKNLFSKYISDPSVINTGDAAALETSLKKFPYCQLLHSFFTRSVSDQENFEKQLARSAVLLPDRTVLYKIIKEAEKLKSTVADIPGVSEEPEEETADELTEAGQTEELKTISPEVEDDSEETPDLQEIELQEFIENQTESNIEEIQLPETEEAEDINELQSESESADLAFIPGLDETPETEVLTEPAFKSSQEEDELEQLILGYSIQGDYLTAESDLDTAPEIQADPTNDKEAWSSPDPAEDDQKVSKYHDNKLPYTFLWWLDKTRKEHSDTYQPYVEFKLDTSQSIRRNSVDQLSSQIIENIFHLQSPIAELENAPRTVPFQVKRKEDYILEKFIREEPHIKAPDSRKLDTENKARKSAEDPNDLVSETLAQIYTDQMLFHKAIDTYKKLSLKFPEKSTYFADQIRELEKKIN